MAGRIEIPGSLSGERRRTNGFDDDVSSDHGQLTPDELDEPEGEGAQLIDDPVTDSDDYDSELDPDLPHYADSKRPKATTRRRWEEQLLPPDQLLAKSQLLARRFAARGQVNNALKQLVRQTALSVLVYGPQHYRYAAAYTELAKGYLDLKGSSFAAQAAEHAEHSRNILLGLQASDETPQSEPERVEFLEISISAFHTLGRAQSLMKKFTEAEHSLLKAEKLLRELGKLSAVSFDTLQDIRIRVWTALAKISNKLNKPAVSVSYFERAIGACEKRHGSSAPQLVALYQGVGNVEQSRDEFANHEKAIDMYLKAHEITTTQSQGEFTEAAAGTARALSAAYARCGSNMAESSAESYLQESLTAYLHVHGPEHATVCEVQDEMAKLMMRSDRQDEGAKLLQETLKVKARVFGDFSQEVLQSYRLLGSLWLSQGQLERALNDLQRAKDIAEFLQGPSCRTCKELGSTIETVLQHPSMEGKQAGSDMKNRPRFNGIVGRSRPAPATGTGVFN